ncbi:MAG: hypothetical protein M3342_17295 [Bacteroidota bacterium]|nr:hypothetical protein [Bacteroidota bacterium]
MNLRITNGFDRLSHPKLLVRAQEILSAMTGNNTHFPDSGVILADLQAKITGYSQAISAAVEGGKVQKLLRNQRRQEVIDVLHALGKYVLYVAGQNQAIAASSGFTIAKEPQAAPSMGQPDNPVFSNGNNSGELIISTNRVQGARAYLFHYTAAPLSDSNVWQLQPGSTCKTVLKNLPVGQRIWCKVTAVGANDQVRCSEASLSKVVQ